MRQPLARRALKLELESNDTEKLSAAVDHAEAVGVDSGTLDRGRSRLKDLKMAEELHQAMRKLPADEVHAVLDRMAGRANTELEQRCAARAADAPREPGLGHVCRQQDGRLVPWHKGMAARLSEREHPPSWPGEPFARELLTRVINTEQADGKTALQVAASIGEWRGTDQSRSRELCERLIALGASPSTKAATCAARAGRPALKRHLLALHQQRCGSAAPAARRVEDEATAQAASHRVKLRPNEWTVRVEVASESLQRVLLPSERVAMYALDMHELGYRRLPVGALLDMIVCDLFGEEEGGYGHATGASSSASTAWRSTARRRCLRSASSPPRRTCS